ncbi:HEAT repeat domain-containing protein [Chloracidobacterium aggregatum]|uniref:HEAT repeat domain-containing protein n=1 Tax=Chloracidobacterium aggregatum TaxID=2851959 RepID=UPI001B8BE00E|nr:HEAT repeat domain-containing protein [Chloracidobacterium aggregatum]QUV92415.1 HEAT repeat domain-containing protein [Chloracidobacterium sp. A]
MRFFHSLLVLWLTGCVVGLWLPVLGQDRYLADLTSPDRRTRQRAAVALGDRRLQAAVPALLEVLRNDLDPQVRAEAAVALGKSRTHRRFHRSSRPCASRTPTYGGPYCAPCCCFTSRKTLSSSLRAGAD